jgi:hypothetical protein
LLAQSALPGLSWQALWRGSAIASLPVMVGAVGMIMLWLAMVLCFFLELAESAFAINSLPKALCAPDP